MATKIELDSNKRNAKNANDGDYVFVVEAVDAKGATIKNVDNDTVAIEGNAADYIVKATGAGVIVTKNLDGLSGAELKAAKQFKLTITLQKENAKKGVDAGVVTLAFADGAIDLTRDGKNIVTGEGVVVTKKAKEAGALDIEIADETFGSVTAEEPTEPQPGQSFTLTTGENDTIIGDAKKNVITGTALEAGDIIIDQTAGDGDVLNLTLSAANGAARVEGIEQINVDWNAFGDATFDATNVTGAAINLTSSKVGYLGNATITAAGANSITAGEGIKNNLTVNGVTGATVNAGAAKTVTVNGTGATTDTATVTAGATTTNVTVNNVETVTATAGAATTDVTITGYDSATVDAGAATDITLTDDATTDTATVKVGADATVDTSAGANGKLTLDIADGKTVTLTDIGTDVTVTGAGNVTLKTSAVDGEKVLNTKTSGTLTVETDEIGALNLTNVAADLVKLTGSVAAAVTVKTGSKVQAAADLGAASFVVGGTATTDTITVTLSKSQATSTTFTGIETVNLVAAADQATASTVTDLTLASLVAAGNTVNLSGSNDVNVTALNAKVLDATNLNGELIVSGTSTAADVTIAGAQGKNDVTFNAAAEKAAFIGQSAADKVNFGTLAAVAAVAATAVTGAGNDTIIANATSLTGSLSVEAGAGDDVVELTSAATTTGTVVLQFGEGTDTLKLAANADLTKANLTITGLEKIKVDGDAIFNADQLSGKTFVVEGTNPSAADTITAEGTANADSIDLSGLSMTDSVSTGMKGAVVNAGAGNDTVIGTSRNDTIDGGTGADTMTGGAGADTFVIDSDGVATAAVADVVTDFSLSAGDTLDFTTAYNAATDKYAEGSAAVADYAAALAAANTIFAANTDTSFVAQQVGSDTYVFFGAALDSAATEVVKLVGVALTDIDATAIA